MRASFVVHQLPGGESELRPGSRLADLKPHGFIITVDDALRCVATNRVVTRIRVDRGLDI